MSWWKNIVGGNTTGTATRVCDKGHPMDPNWKTCAYCDAESRATQRTARIPEQENPEPNEPMQRSTAMQRPTTKIDTGGAGEGGGATKFDTSADEAAPQRSRAPRHNRRITGVLVTFSWRFQGELFVLYEGRNVIGSAGGCDVQVTTDPSMSSEHAVILCRAGRDELHDLLSTNGTFLNEKYVERDGADLIDKAMIKTGGTVFEFRKITSGIDKAARAESPQYKEEEPESHQPGETAI